jgi:uracil-DNA glycosylase
MIIITLGKIAEKREEFNSFVSMPDEIPVTRTVEFPDKTCVPRELHCADAAKNVVNGLGREPPALQVAGETPAADLGREAGKAP